MIRETCQVAVLGSGFAGSLMALLLHLQGYRVVLLERGTHPRFSLGESSTPLGNLSLEEIAREYGLDWLMPLAEFGSWKRAYPDLVCGLKRGFTFVHHEPDVPFARGRTTPASCSSRRAATMSTPTRTGYARTSTTSSCSRPSQPASSISTASALDDRPRAAALAVARRARRGAGRDHRRLPHRCDRPGRGAVRRCWASTTSPACDANEHIRRSSITSTGWSCWQDVLARPRRPTATSIPTPVTRRRSTRSSTRGGCGSCASTTA